MGNTTHEKSMKILINRKRLRAMIPLCDRTIYNLEKRGEFPKRIVLTCRNVAWELEEVESWIRERKEGGFEPNRPGPKKTD